MDASRSGRNLLLYPLYVGCREYYNKYDREYEDMSSLEASCWKEYLDARHGGREPISP